ncbi:pilus assembly protein TadG-related protein [Ramlibacter solisilvae]
MLLTAAMVMFLLLGFIGVALDFARLFVVKSELQTAMDSCALSAAQELDGQTDAIVRAQNAGKNASDLNGVGFQSTLWGGLGLLDKNTEITFRTSGYSTTTIATAARYVQCQHTHTGFKTYLLQALGAYGNSALGVSTRNVTASAVATRASAQTACPIPLAVRPKTAGAPGPNYGYAPGEWVTMLTKSDSGANGYIGWANLDGSSSASETVAEMNGKCGVTVGTTLGTPGVQSTVADNWNWRFGIYKNNQYPYDQYKQPDRTGYIYSAATWPSQSNAYGDYQSKSASYANCIQSTTVNNQSVKDCGDLHGYDLNSFKDLIPGGAGSTGGHKDYGTNRRVVLVPVTNSYPGSVADYACMLLLQPLDVGMNRDVQLEFIGNASVPGSPCATSGLPGGVAGPLVPVLVR